MLSTPVPFRRRVAIAMVAVAMGIAVPVAIAQEAAPIFGTDAPEVVNGTAADDALYGLAGNDTLNGLGGNDELDGGSGSDVLSGGDGNDAVAYDGATAVSVSLDGIANDGIPGEGDNVGADVEDIFGTAGDDKLTGNDASNTIDGGEGEDTIVGGGGSDAIYSEGGNDTVRARDGKADRVDCGPGQDSAVLDRGDKAVGCEDVELPVVTPPFVVAVTPGSGRIARIRLVGVLNGSRIVVACRSGCRPATPLTRRVVTVASARVSAGQARIRLPLRPRITGGTRFEIGVTAPRAEHGRCNVYRVGRGLRGLPLQRGVTCKSAARTR